MTSRQRLDALVRTQFEVSWSKARSWIETGKVWIAGHPVIDIGLMIEAGTEVVLKMNTPKPRAATRTIVPLNKSDVIYCDTQVIVVNKPAGLSTVAFEKSELNHLERSVCEYLRQPKVVVVHRLDRDTSGLIVFARTTEAGFHLENQFRHHTVLRRYFALVQGEAQSRTIQSFIIENRGDGLRGSVSSQEAQALHSSAKLAITHVNALEVFNGITLIECRLETGRTHQIRIHLSETGHPLLGEKAYNREYKGQKIEAPRMMLHAAELGFVHPTKNTQMNWMLSPPTDFLILLNDPARSKLRLRLKT